jgi:alkylhydroperoxidase/carboxymuconolactone decarboxylase family protein YurZ
MADQAKLPGQYRWLFQEYPRVGKAYEGLGEAVHAAGPLDERTRALVKLGISMGARLEGGVHSHTRKALQAGVKPEEILHAALLAMPTLGLPSTMAALTWVRDILEGVWAFRPGERPPPGAKPPLGGAIEGPEIAIPVPPCPKLTLSSLKQGRPKANLLETILIGGR